MSQKKTALGGFSQMRDDELLLRAQTIMHAMQQNSYFLSPSPDIPELALLLNAFREKLVISRRKGSPQDTALKNESRKSLTAALSLLAAYVTREANGNLPALLSSGFETNRYTRTAYAPETVTGVLLADGLQSGQMRLDFNRQANVLMYEYRIAPDQGGSPGEWPQPFITASSRNNVLAPLEPFRRYYVQVRAINRQGKSEWSEVVSFITR